MTKEPQHKKEPISYGAANGTVFSKTRKARRLIAMSLIGLAFLVGGMVIVMHFGLLDVRQDTIDQDHIGQLEGNELDVHLLEQMIATADQEVSIDDYIFVGKFHEQEGEFAIAREYYYKALEIEHDNIPALVALSDAYRLDSNIDNAAMQLEVVIEIVANQNHVFHTSLPIYEAQLSALRSGDAEYKTLDINEVYGEGVEQICC